MSFQWVFQQLLRDFVLWGNMILECINVNLRMFAQQIYKHIFTIFSLSLSLPQPTNPCHSISQSNKKTPVFCNSRNVYGPDYEYNILRFIAPNLWKRTSNKNRGCRASDNERTNVLGEDGVEGPRLPRCSQQRNGRSVSQCADQGNCISISFVASSCSLLLRSYTQNGFYPITRRVVQLECIGSWWG